MIEHPDGERCQLAPSCRIAVDPPVTLGIGSAPRAPSVVRVVWVVSTVEITGAPGHPPASTG